MQLGIHNYNILLGQQQSVFPLAAAATNGVTVAIVSLHLMNKNVPYKVRREALTVPKRYSRQTETATD